MWSWCRRYLSWFHGKLYDNIVRQSRHAAVDGTCSKRSSPTRYKKKCSISFGDFITASLSDTVGKYVFVGCVGRVSVKFLRCWKCGFGWLRALKFKAIKVQRQSSIPKNFSSPPLGQRCWFEVSVIQGCNFQVGWTTLDSKSTFCFHPSDSKRHHNNRSSKVRNFTHFNL